jgi:hypothetical protein
VREATRVAVGEGVDIVERIHDEQKAREQIATRVACAAMARDRRG